jgi:DNA-cytosine methyltransferase
VDLRPFTILSLCAGVGGLDLGLRVAQPNSRTVCFVEIEAYAAAILATRMEQNALDQAPIWTDLRTFDGKPWRSLVDCITAGYPCQPFSVAGKQLGDKDPRHLWPDVFRVVREIDPPLCFFENVPGHLRLGFRQVHDDLRSLGYRVKAGLFTAEEVGASHKRERLFILAYRESVFGPCAMPERDSQGRPAQATGICHNDAPPKAQDVSKRIQSLANRLGNEKIHYENGNETEWYRTVRSLQDDIRTTWERAVEDFVGEVVTRFKNKVDTKGLARLTVLTMEDCQVMRDAYGRCSSWLHSSGVGLNPNLPSANNIQQEIDALKTWHEEIRQRQKAIVTI